MANSYDYFKQQVAQMENIRAKTAHEQHIVEFRAMCAKMISDAIPKIKQECLEAMRQELKQKEQQEERKPKHQQQVKVDVEINADSLRQKVMDAIRRAFH